MQSYRNIEKIDLENDTKPQKPWGKLVSVNGNLENIPLFASIYKIGRLSTNDISIDDIRISGCHCVLKRNTDGEVSIEDFSSNGTYLENMRIGKGKRIKIMTGSKFYILHTTKVLSRDQTLGFILTMDCANKNQLKRVRWADTTGNEDLAVYTKQIKAPNPDDEKLSEHVMCHLCRQCLYKCAVIEPCQHNFCGACLSEWMVKNRECPVCIEEILKVERLQIVDDVVESFLLNHPQWRRSAQEYQIMDEKDKLKTGELSSTKDKYNCRAVELFNMTQEETEEPLFPTLRTKSPQEGVRLQTQHEKMMKYYDMVNKFTCA